MTLIQSKQNRHICNNGPIPILVILQVTMTMIISFHHQGKTTQNSLKMLNTIIGNYLRTVKLPFFSNHTILNLIWDACNSWINHLWD